MRRRMSVVAILMICVLTFLVACSSSSGSVEPGEKLKVGLMVQGTANDGGWNSSALNGILLIEEQLGAEISVTENIAISDIEEIYRSYGEQGYDLVVGHGYAFSDGALAIGPEYPNTKFLVTSSGIFQEPNVASIRNNSDEQGFISGAFAARFTESGIIGIIGGMEIPSIMGWLEGAKRGALYANPSVTVLDSYTGNFEDTLQAKELALAMIDRGADILLQNLDPAGAGVLEACLETETAYVGSIMDQYEAGPDVVVTSGLSDLALSILQIAELVQNNEMEAISYSKGIQDGVIKLAPFRGRWEDRVSQETIDFMDQLMADIMNDQVDIYK